jgi:hypothetical protein
MRIGVDLVARVEALLARAAKLKRLARDTSTTDGERTAAALGALKATEEAFTITAGVVNQLASHTEAAE